MTKYADEEKFKQMCNAVSEYGDERAAKAVAEKTLKIIDKLLEMGMPLEQALQATEIDEKTYRENLAKHADKN